MNQQLDIQLNENKKQIPSLKLENKGSFKKYVMKF